MKTAWEKKVSYTVVLADEKVILGLSAENNDNVTLGLCTFYEFLHGKFHHTIRETFGNETLEEIIESITEICKKC